MVIALDIGTSSARASIYDGAGRLVEGRFHQVPCPPRVTPDGGVEHDARALFDAVVTCLDAVQAGRPALPIAGVGLCTFWHGLLGFDERGRPVTPVHLWADTRGTEDAALLRSALDEEALRGRTGCHLHASYWPAKLRWFARAHASERRPVARWGSFGEYLELRLFGEAATSLSMASGTGLLDQDRLRWDAEALAAADLEPAQLFPLTDRAEGRRGLIAPWSVRWPALRGVPWFPAIGDGAASSVGSDCLDPRRIALNVGTSAALRVVSPAPPVPPRGLWRYRVDRALGIVGGATSEGGNVYAWCQETLRVGSVEEIEAALAAGQPGAERLTALPFLAGERSPGWRGRRRAAIVGLGLDTTALDIMASMLLAVALRLALVYDLLAPCAAPDHEIVASGGAIERSPAWAGMIADALGRPVRRSREREATSRGVALLALQTLGRLPDLAAVEAALGETIEPDPARHARYRDALARQRSLDQLV